MKRSALLGSLLVAMVLCIAACGSARAPVTQATATPRPQAHGTATATALLPTYPPLPGAATDTPAAKTWVTVQSFNGTTNDTTPVFSVPDGARILWSGFATGDNATLAIGGYNADGSYLGVVGGGNLPSDGTTVSGTYTVQGAHDLSLHIAITNGGYTIGVEVYQ